MNLIVKTGSACLVAATAAFLSSTAQAAVQSGDNLAQIYLAPTIDSIYEVNSYTYTGGTQTFPGTLWFETVVTPNSVTFDFTNGNCTSGCFWTEYEFNGLSFNNFTNANAFSGWTITNDDVGVKSFSNTGNSFIINWSGGLLQGNVTVSSGTIPAAPEPATWIMMIVGFGLAGSALRRNRTVVRTKIAFS